ncbi:MAG: VCBS repeat-containing protein [Deltaproteobacteria bacterium]|nr:VCBS repeat-containing protein [Deltaproteobacteria bacterium]
MSHNSSLARGWRLFLRAAVVPLSLSSLHDSQAEIGDYDGDGRSDFAVATVDRPNSRTIFSVRDSTTGQVKRMTVGLAGDALVPADYNGDGRTEAAVVFVRPDGDLEWRIEDEEGVETTFGWGINQDRPLAGDVDCDGKADLVVVRKASGTLRWFIQYSTGQTLDRYGFGDDDDTPWLADMDGDGCDELVLSRRGTSDLVWFWENVGDTAATRINWGLRNDTPLNPYDVNGDGRADLIVTRKVSRSDLAFIRYDDATNEVRSLGSSGHIPFVGNFDGAGPAVFGKVVRNKSGDRPLRYILRPAATGQTSYEFGVSNQIVVRPDGSAVQPGVSGGGSSGGSGAVCDSTSDFQDGANGSLWKPVSDSTGRAVFLLSSSYFTSVSSVHVLSNSGSEIATATRRPSLGNGNRSHFDVSRSASSMSQYKPLTVQLRLKNGTKECRTVPNPTSRID